MKYVFWFAWGEEQQCWCFLQNTMALRSLRLCIPDSAQTCWQKASSPVEQRRVKLTQVEEGKQGPSQGCREQCRYQSIFALCPEIIYDLFFASDDHSDKLSISLVSLHAPFSMPGAKLFSLVHVCACSLPHNALLHAHTHAHITTIKNHTICN